MFNGDKRKLLFFKSRSSVMMPSEIMVNELNCKFQINVFPCTLSRSVSRHTCTGSPILQISFFVHVNYMPPPPPEISFFAINTFVSYPEVRGTADTYGGA